MGYTRWEAQEARSALTVPEIRMQQVVQMMRKAASPAAEIPQIGKAMAAQETRMALYQGTQVPPARGIQMLLAQGIQMATLQGIQMLLAQGIQMVPPQGIQMLPLQGIQMAPAQETPRASLHPARVPPIPRQATAQIPPPALPTPLPTADLGASQMDLPKRIPLPRVQKKVMI